MPLDPLSNVVSALERENVIPDVIPTFVPTHLFSILYPNGKEVLLGNEFRVDETVDEPAISFAPINMPVEHADNTVGDSEGGVQEPSYTLVMLDPDAPTHDNPEFRSFRHWVVTGLKSPADPGSVSATSSSAALKTRAAVTPYRPPGPRPASGSHRYTFLLFLEPPSATPLEIPLDAPEYRNELEQRRKWSAVDFAQQYGLAIVGANFLTIRAAEGA
ncbi:hypothetical protein PHLGIDRAFT_112865 [Phlebiopsis gigantea 11061_1 CR5-6]|uniref:PEBP-like protein n=1 Tax=Phlebiopsis gigantea (strain 11061_1 CR5-6) TaxID=745531 RepID=A0A0C3S251_PHLG1|nr:hypothetical protein PHLGIDRAFT_112865 [Phlebiopsis gigantea 11061_1 CR5-6]